MAWQYHPKIECDYFEERVGVWKDIVRFIEKPKTFAEKSLIPLWSFYTLVNRQDREVAKDGKHWRACGANMFEVNALQIDYDAGDVLISDFIENHNFLFALYTSPSHKEEHHKFRVIIPLAAPLLNAYLMKGNVREYLLSHFKGCDLTTINSFRKQRMPATPMSGDAYFYHISNGERLALDMLKIVELSSQTALSELPKDTIDLETELDPFDTPVVVMEQVQELKRLMLKYAEELEILKDTPRGGGTVHYSLTRMTSALAMAGMSQKDMVNYFEKHGVEGAEINKLIMWSTNR